MIRVSRYQLKETSAEGTVASQLILRQATSSDSGKYVCIASNPYGRDEMAIYFSVKGNVTATLTMYRLSVQYSCQAILWKTMCVELEGTCGKDLLCTRCAKLALGAM